MTFVKKHGSLMLLILLVGVLIGNLTHRGIEVAGAASPAAAPLAIPNPAQLSTAFSTVAKQVEPSVVQVSTTIEPTRTQARGRRGQSDDPRDLFRRFFGDDPFGDMPQRPFRSQGLGSGFVVDRNGYVLTNNHVVEDATRIQVKFQGETKLHPAKLIGTDPELDLAVLKVEAGRPLTPVKIGNSDAVEVGDWAVAIGSPFGLETTVTAGIISAKGRDLGGPDHQLQRFLQTDAAINRGNSGGPLLNINGEAIGVNTMIATSTGSFEGLGFALPINLAVNSYNQIVKTGRVSRGAIGIEFSREQKPELLKAYGASEGVFVQRVRPGGPADRAGLKEGDVIVAIDGKAVKDGEDLTSRVSQAPVGSRVTIKVLREGKPHELPVEIGERAEVVNGRQAEPGRADAERPGTPARFGISVRDFPEKDGVLVTEVEPGSFAEDIGVREGDVILAINRQPVRSADDVKRVAGGLKAGGAVAFKLMRKADQEWQPVFAAGTVPR